MNGLDWTGARLSQRFFIPKSPRDFSERWALIERSGIIGPDSIVSIKKLISDKPNDDKSWSDSPQRIFEGCFKATSISHYEYAIIYALNEIRSMIERRDPHLLVLIDDEYKYFQRVTANEPLYDEQKEQGANYRFDPRSDVDIDIDKNRFRSLGFAAHSYGERFASVVKAKLALLEILATVYRERAIPALVQISVHYLAEPLVLETIDNFRKTLFLTKGNKVAEHFMTAVTKSFRIDSRRNQARYYNRWQISSDYKKYVAIIKSIQREKDFGDAYLYFTEEQIEIIVSSRKDTPALLAAEFVKEKYGFENDKIIEEANAERAKIFAGFLAQYTPHGKPELSSSGRPMLQVGLAGKTILELMPALEHFMDQYLSDLVLRTSPLKYLERL